MRYHEFAGDTPAENTRLGRAPFDINKLRRKIEHQFGPYKSFLTDTNRAALPFHVEYRPEPVGDIAAQIRERHDWCDQACPRRYASEPLRDRGEIAGQRFFFEAEEDAVMFTLRFS